MLLGIEKFELHLLTKGCYIDFNWHRQPVFLYFVNMLIKGAVGMTARNFPSWY